MLQQAARLLKSSREEFIPRLEQQLERHRALERELQQLQAKLASSRSGDLSTQAINVDGIRVVASRLEGVAAKELPPMVDQLKDKLKQAVILLAVVNGTKINLIAGVTKAQTARMKAGELLNFVATQVGGKGGGRPDLAQGGGSEPDKLDGALESVVNWVKERV